MHEPGLRGLRVERPAREAPARGQANGDRHRQALAVMHLPGDIDELVETARDEVGELHLADRAQADDRRSNGGADDRRLGQRGVHHPLGAELLLKSVRHLEGPAEGADVLAHRKHPLVRAHLLAQPVRDRLQVCHLRHRRHPRETAPGRQPVAQRLGLALAEDAAAADAGSGIPSPAPRRAACSISPATCSRRAATSTPRAATRRSSRRSGHARSTARPARWGRSACRRARRGRACASSPPRSASAPRRRARVRARCGWPRTAPRRRCRRPATPGKP